jgi:hypothetical protein
MKISSRGSVAPCPLPAGLEFSAVTRRESSSSLLYKDNNRVIKFIY